MTPVELVPMSVRSARSVLGGGLLLPDAVAWHPEYPLTETMLGLSMVARAHAHTGWDHDQVPDWWMYQMVVPGRSGQPEVVGDIGFHGPPDPSLVVEIGYDVVPARRRRGIATAACAGIIERAWADGAQVVRAETDAGNAASRRVLLKAGFRLQPDHTYRIDRPS